MKDLPYTALIKEEIIKKVEKIPLEINTTNDFTIGENCFRLKVLEEIKKMFK